MKQFHKIIMDLFIPGEHFVKKRKKSTLVAPKDFKQVKRILRLNTPFESEQGDSFFEVGMFIP